ncbi:hypothetical protein LguiB_015160 [Lonicera macranthoides]
MGIPSFYRWLVERYPLAAKDAIEESPNFVNGFRVPSDTTQPNPNGLEFDNLYLDMNGIIHPCFHPEGLPAPKTYDEMKSVQIFCKGSILLLFFRKVQVLDGVEVVIQDGVAPRAKMNQQRSRRFRAAKDAADERSGTEKSRGISELEGENLDTTKLDSNIITPGTEFMALLSSALRYYVHLRMNGDPGWRGVKVIVSDASVPGEGEHKIMSYIRLQRNLPGFDPNTRHCLYGLDADLIMLALATHEIHFSILREEVVQKKDMNIFKKMGGSKEGEVRGENLDDFILRQKFQNLQAVCTKLIRSGVILEECFRNYLAHELRIPDSTMETDLERLIDDFVFMCLFVGNDFLPHVPSLEISEGAIDLLMIIYKKEFVNMGGYLTSSFEVNLKHVEHFVQAVGSHEDAIFKKRIQVNKQRETQFRRSLTNSGVNESKDSTVCISDAGNSVIDKVELGVKGWKKRYYTEKFEVKTDDERERTQRDTVLKYIEGICWVMHYYYQGVCSWQWFYPYHYAPFASDFRGLDQLEIQFTLGEPFKPLNQLMAVLPAASAQALPLLYSKLMTDPSSPLLDYYPSDFELDLNGKHLAWQTRKIKHEIGAFRPQKSSTNACENHSQLHLDQWKTDVLLNLLSYLDRNLEQRKKAVCKLPFIMESRLLSEIAKVEPMLTDEEKKRNTLGLDMLFVHISHPLAVKILSFCERNKDHPKLPMAKFKKKIDPIFSGGMNGYMCISDKPMNPVEIVSPIDDMATITGNKVICVLYKYPSFHPHIPKPPEGVVMPAESVSEQDLRPPPVMWHIPILFGRELSQRPIPKYAISGPELANSARQLVYEYYHGKWKTAYVIRENHTNGGKRMDGGSENCKEGGAKRSKKRKKRSGSGGKLVPQGGQVPPKLLPGGSEIHTDGGAKKRKPRWKRHKLGNEEVPQGQLSSKPLGADSENHLDSGAEKREPIQKFILQPEFLACSGPSPTNPDQAPMRLGQSGGIFAPSMGLAREGNTVRRVMGPMRPGGKSRWKRRKLGNEEVLQEGQLSSKPLGVDSENRLDSGAEKREPIQKYILQPEFLASHGPSPTNPDQAPMRLVQSEGIFCIPEQWKIS